MTFANSVVAGAFSTLQMHSRRGGNPRRQNERRERDSRRMGKSEESAE